MEGGVTAVLRSHVKGSRPSSLLALSRAEGQVAGVGARVPVTARGHLAVCPTEDFLPLAAKPPSYCSCVWGLLSCPPPLPYPRPFLPRLTTPGDLNQWPG